MPIPSHLTAHAAPVFSPPDMPSAPSSSSAGEAASSEPPSKRAAPRIIQSALQKSLTQQVQSKQNAGLPADVWLGIADHAVASPQSVARLASTSRGMRGLMADHLKLASILGNVDKLRDADHFTALLSGEDKVAQGVAYCVDDLKSDSDKMEALEVLGANLINLYHGGTLFVAIDAFNEVMARYQGPRSALLKELEQAATKAVQPGKLTPDMNDIFQLRQSTHFPEIIDRAKKGEPVEALIKQFGIATASAQDFLAQQAEK